MRDAGTGENDRVIAMMGHLLRGAALLLLVLVLVLVNAGST